MSIRMKVWGDYACFTRPEMKSERVSYDVMTPSAARGIVESIFWHPGMKWMIDAIYVCKPILFTNIRRNEVSEKISCNVVRSGAKSGKPLYLATPQCIQRGPPPPCGRWSTSSRPISTSPTKPLRETTQESSRRCLPGG